MRTAAIAIEFPEAALALCDERIALGMALGDEEQCSSAAYAKALTVGLYPRALGKLDRLDTMALAELGRPFSSFPVSAGRAFGDYRSGRKITAIMSAKQAFALALGQLAPFPGISNLGPAPRLPSRLTDALVVIAGLWDDVTLGPPPEV